MRIAISGSSSGIGMYLSEKLNEVGHATTPLGGSKSKLWKLGEPFPKHIEVDLLIHLAHDRTLTIEENIDAAKILCNTFEGNKIFLSSFSAHSNTRSKYGRSKYEIERVFAEAGGQSLRAGVIYGANVGGIYAQLETLLGRSRITPVPYRGIPLLFTTHIEDLTSEVISMLHSVGSGTVFAANPSPISLNELLNQISANSRLKQYFLPLPKEPFDVLLRLLIRVAPNFPMADSLLSLSRTANYEELSMLKLPQSKFRRFKIEG